MKRLSAVAHVVLTALLLSAGVWHPAAAAAPRGDPRPASTPWRPGDLVIYAAGCHTLAAALAVARMRQGRTPPDQCFVSVRLIPARLVHRHRGALGRPGQRFSI